MLRRLKRTKPEPEEPPRKSTPERNRLEKAEEAYLQRLATSIRQGTTYVNQPKTPAPQALVPPILSPAPPLETGGSMLRPPAASPPNRPQPVSRPQPAEPALAVNHSVHFQGLENIPQATLDKVLKPGTPPPRTAAAPVAPPVPPVPQASPVASSPAPTADDRVQIIRPPEPTGTFQTGAIIQLQDGTVAIYKSPARGKEYEIVYVLRPSGRMAPEGIALYAYETKKLGQLPREIFDEFEKKLRWDRDAILFHLEKYEYCLLIPAPLGSGTGPTSAGAGGATRPRLDPPTAPLQDPARDLTRGRRVFISFGPGKTWEAIYWGRDLLGHVVAHRTHNAWSLMHLDINKFKDSTEVGEVLSDDEIKTIQRDILTTQEREGKG